MALERRRRAKVLLHHGIRTWAKGDDLAHVKGDDMDKVMDDMGEVTALEYLEM